LPTLYPADKPQALYVTSPWKEGSQSVFGVYDDAAKILLREKNPSCPGFTATAIGLSEGTAVEMFPHPFPSGAGLMRRKLWALRMPGNARITTATLRMIA
jgi:hypothetical protein